MQLESDNMPDTVKDIIGIRIEAKEADEVNGLARSGIYHILLHRVGDNHAMAWGCSQYLYCQSWTYHCDSSRFDWLPAPESSAIDLQGSLSCPD